MMYVLRLANQTPGNTTGGFLVLMIRRSYEKKESLSSKTNVPSYLKPTEPTRTRDTGVSSKEDKIFMF